MSTDTGKILFVRLCAAFRNPGSLRIGLDKLVEWVYFEEAKGESTKYTRRIRIRESLDLIANQSGWCVAWEDGGKQVYIQRRPTDVIEQVAVVEGSVRQRGGNCGVV